MWKVALKSKVEGWSCSKKQGESFPFPGRQSDRKRVLASWLVAAWRALVNPTVGRQKSAACSVICQFLMGLHKWVQPTSRLGRARAEKCSRLERCRFFPVPVRSRSGECGQRPEGHADQQLLFRRLPSPLFPLLCCACRSPPLPDLHSARAASNSFDWIRALDIRGALAASLRFES